MERNMFSFCFGSYFLLASTLNTDKRIASLTTAKELATYSRKSARLNDGQMKFIWLALRVIIDHIEEKFGL